MSWKAPALHRPMRANCTQPVGKRCLVLILICLYLFIIHCDNDTNAIHTSRVIIRHLSNPFGSRTMITVTWAALAALIGPNFSQPAAKTAALTNHEYGSRRGNRSSASKAYTVAIEQCALCLITNSARAMFKSFIHADVTTGKNFG